MNFKQLFTDDDAVSPVIGVILMVAITVILAAVIGTFVLGLGDQVSDTSPQASFTFDLTQNDASSGNGDVLTVTHDGGDKISPGQLSITASGATANDGSLSYDAEVKSANTWEDISGSSNDVTAGSSIDISSDEFVESGTTNVLPQNRDSSNGNEVIELNAATVRVTWQSANGGDTATLGKWTGPDA